MIELLLSCGAEGDVGGRHGKCAGKGDAKGRSVLGI
jgi:hypothetical protein